MKILRVVRVDKKKLLSHRFTSSASFFEQILPKISTEVFLINLLKKEALEVNR
jgi:hypothetical protein